MAYNNLNTVSGNNIKPLTSNIRVCFPVVVLCVHNDHEVSGDVHSPGEATGGDQDLHCPGSKQLLNDLALHVSESLVQVRHSVTKGLLQSLQQTDGHIH